MSLFSRSCPGCKRMTTTPDSAFPAPANRTFISCLLLSCSHLMKHRKPGPLDKWTSSKPSGQTINIYINTYNVFVHVPLQYLESNDLSNGRWHLNIVRLCSPGPGDKASCAHHLQFTKRGLAWQGWLWTCHHFVELYHCIITASHFHAHRNPCCAAGHSSITNTFPKCTNLRLRELYSLHTSLKDVCPIYEFFTYIFVVTFPAFLWNLTWQPELREILTRHPFESIWESPAAVSDATRPEESPVSIAKQGPLKCRP